MKKEQGIRWKESIGNHECRGNILEVGMSIGSEVLLGVICTLLFVLSARIMFEDVYIYCGFGAGNILLMALIAFIICGAMEAAARTSAIWGGLVQCMVLVIGIAGCIVYLAIGDNAENILAGLEKIMSFYVEHWNLYYKTSAGGFMGDLRYVEEALDFLTVIVFMTLIWIARIVETNMIMVIPSVLVLVLELMVGHSPAVLGLFLMFAGCLIANASVWRTPDFKTALGKRKAWLNRYASWITVGICTLFMCLIAYFAGGPSAESLVDKSPMFRKWVDEVVNDITGASIWDIFDGEGIFPLGNNHDTNTERLSNNSPVFEDKVFMELELTFKPTSTIYLRGFYGDTYEDGVWDRDTEAFLKECEEKGIDSEKVSEEIVNLGVSKLLEMYGGTDVISSLTIGGRGKITYSDSSGKRCYLPYFSQVYDDTLYIEGDGRYMKEKGTENVTFGMWIYAGEYKDNMTLLMNGYRCEWESWYEQYVRENYRDVEVNAPYVVNVAEEIDSWDKPDGYDTYMTQNQKRLYKAEMVALWLERNTSYSTNPPELPSGVDPIEYFLKTSRTGYCMHYASASVMILRQLGVPARYASGFIAAPFSFEEGEAYYKAEIMDNQAHAWVEIYLNGIGWVPIEVTKGYNRSSVSQEEPTSERDTQQQTSSTEPTSDNETSTEEMTTSIDQQTTSAGNSDEQTTTNQNYGKPDEDSTGGISMKLILTIMAIAIVVPLIIYCLYRIRGSYREKLMRQIAKKRTSKAIKLMNRRIYKKLRMTGKIFKSDIRDEGYFEVLVRTYPDIPKDELQRFMDIVKAAAFSKREFSVEEMEFCYGVYNRIIKNS